MIYIKLLLTAIFWGGTFVAGKIISHSVHPASAAFLRFLIASLCLIVIVYRREIPLPQLRPIQIAGVVLLGLTGVFAYNMLFFTGLKHIAAGRAALLIATNPIIICLLSALLFKEGLNWIKGMGICLSVAGAMIVISNGQIAAFDGYKLGVGELMIFGCVLSWACYSLIGKVAMKQLSPIILVTYSAVVGTGLLLVPAVYSGMLSEIGTYSLLDWTCLAYLGCFGTVIGFYWYYQGIDRIGAMKASVFINFVPVSALFFSYFILKEPLAFSLLTGGAMVVMGVYLVNASSRVARLWR